MKKINLPLFIVFAMICSSVFAQRSTDIEGAEDFPTISRFKGAVIEFYKETKWGNYKLPIDEEGELDWENYQRLEGKITRIQYSVKGEDNVDFVLHNYKAAFNRAKYKVLFARSYEELKMWSGWFALEYYGSDFERLGNEKFGYNIKFPRTLNQGFIAAKTSVAGKEIYATAHIAVIEDDDYLLITQDVIEIEPLETGWITVGNLTNDITLYGFSTLYGLHFEVGKAILMPESDESLQTIASYINENPDKKFYIVGHTDNTGGFESNMTLSEERAKSVMAELISKYDSKEEQLKAYGVSSLSPVASNSTEEGKAKNRRVEIVEQ